MTSSGTPPLLVERVLEEEYAFLHGRPTKGHQHRRRRSSQPPSYGAMLTPATRRFAFLAAECGGSSGLASLQELAQAGLLDKFDYLSTVSGGGYIGGWLSAWRQHAHERGDADPSEQLVRLIEPEPVVRLRRVIKFSIRERASFTADVWTLGGTMFRNLLVNWLVLIPLIAAAAMLPIWACWACPRSPSS